MAPATTTTKTKMPYKFLGNSGLLVSKLALGSWMFKDDKYTVDAWYAMMKIAYEHGVNLFDNAEFYGNGQAEENMGAAIMKGVEDGIWSREDLVVTTKIFLGSKYGFGPGGPNDQGLSRKHIVEGMRGSLKRFDMDYVDVVFCSRPDPHTPIEETVRAMNFVINQGWAFYWGTSHWLPSAIEEACQIADRLGLIRPIVEQPEYSIFERNNVDYAFADLYKKYKLGLTTSSPLAFGSLTGKYSAGTPEGSRYSHPVFQSITKSDEFAARVKMADQLKPIAAELGCSLAQLAVAWVASNDNVSSVLLAGSRPSQLEETLQSLEFVSKLTPEVKAKIDAIVQFVPTVPEMNPYAYVRARYL